MRAGGQWCPEQSGDFLGARLGLAPGRPAPGVACPWGASLEPGAEGHGTHCWTGAECLLPDPECRAHLRLGLGLWGTWLGGPGRRGQLLLMSQGHV